jgi:hypothetical protein
VEWGRLRRPWGADVKRQGNRTPGDPRVPTLPPCHPRPYETHPLPCLFHKLPALESLPQRGLAVGVFGSFSRLYAYGLAEPSQTRRQGMPGAAPKRSGTDAAWAVRVRGMLALDVPDGWMRRGMGIVFLSIMSVQTRLKGT